MDQIFTTILTFVISDRFFDFWGLQKMMRLFWDLALRTDGLTSVFREYIIRTLTRNGLITTKVYQVYLAL